MHLPGPQRHLLVQPRVAMRNFVSAAERESLEAHFSAPPKVSAEATQPEKQGEQLTFFRRSLASCVRYGGRLSLHFKILSIVFFRFSPVNGGYENIVGQKQQFTTSQQSQQMLPTWISLLIPAVLRSFSNKATMGLMGVHLLLLSACHTWELPNSTSPLRGYVHSSLGSLEPWGRRREWPGWYSKHTILYKKQEMWLNMSTKLQPEWIYKICVMTVWHTCIQ